jgi:hypothetical protein
MKKIVTVIALLLIVGVGYSQNDEKRIAFNKGTLKICSLSNMKISGYDGDEVIIKSISNGKRPAYYSFNQKNNIAVSDSTLVSSYRIFSGIDKKHELEKGLKSLGNKSTNPADNLYLDIEENPGELIIRDYDNSKRNEIKYLFHFNNSYELLIPNTIKLLWNTENCAKTNSNTFFVTPSSKPWEVSNFNGEVEISASYGSIHLTDVGGPVIANTIGGNIKVIFDRISPTSLYSLISRDGYIDVELPLNAELNVDVEGYRILSDIDFKILNEDITGPDGIKEMKLQLNTGGTKMKLDAGLGTVYIRKNK